MVSNIAQMNVTREKAGEKAIMIIEVDSRNCDEAIEEIPKNPLISTMSISLNRRKHVYSIKELVEQADLDFQGNVAELMIATEYQLTGRATARSSPPHGTQSRSHESLCRARSQ